MEMIVDVLLEAMGLDTSDVQPTERDSDLDETLAARCASL